MKYNSLKASVGGNT